MSATDTLIYEKKLNVVFKGQQAFRVSPNKLSKSYFSRIFLTIILPSLLNNT